jgi:hypothetical protein
MSAGRIFIRSPFRPASHYDSIIIQHFAEIERRRDAPHPALFCRRRLDSKPFCSVYRFQVHSAVALARLVRDGVTEARSSAIAEIDACTHQADLLDRHAAAALGGVFRVDAALASFLALAKQSLAPSTLMT